MKYYEYPITAYYVIQESVAYLGEDHNLLREYWDLPEETLDWMSPEKLEEIMKTDKAFAERFKEHLAGALHGNMITDLGIGSYYCSDNLWTLVEDYFELRGIDVNDDDVVVEFNYDDLAVEAMGSRAFYSKYHGLKPSEKEISQLVLKICTKFVNDWFAGKIDPADYGY